MNLSTLLNRMTEIDRRAGHDVFGGEQEWTDKVNKVRQRIMDSAAPVQRAFISDRSMYALALCSRQCGKGWSVARMMIDTALERPGNVILYVRKTLQLAKQTMWSEPRDGLPIVLRELGLEESIDYTLNLSSTTVRFKNGSEIRFDGIERARWSDVRGKKYALIVLDEMQEQEEEGLIQAIEADIPYCFMMYTGRFVGIGTPNLLPVGRFHDICEDIESRRTGWSVHRWTAKDLSDRTPVWKGMLDWKARFNISDDNPKWLRDGLGLWASDDSELMLAVPGNGVWDGALPELIPSYDGRPVARTQKPNVFAGLDFGFVQPCGLVVGSISREEGVLREVWSEKRSGLITQDIAAWLKSVMERYGIIRFYADCAEPGKIEELRREYKIPIVGCDKTDYDLKLGQMRGALVEDRLKIMESSVLRDELRTLGPDPKELLKGHFRPKPGQEDHCFDGLRYLFNGVYKEYIAAPEPPRSEVELREIELKKMAQDVARREQLERNRRSSFDPRGRRR